MSSLNANHLNSRVASWTLTNWLDFRASSAIVTTSEMSIQFATRTCGSNSRIAWILSASILTSSSTQRYLRPNKHTRQPRSSMAARPTPRQSLLTRTPQSTLVTTSRIAACWVNRGRVMVSARGTLCKVNTIRKLSWRRRACKCGSKHLKI